MSSYVVTVTPSSIAQSINLPFAANSVAITNNGGQWLTVADGGTVGPYVQNAILGIRPPTFHAVVSFGAPTGQINTGTGNSATLTFSDSQQVAQPGISIAPSLNEGAPLTTAQQLVSSGINTGGVLTLSQSAVVPATATYWTVDQCQVVCWSNNASNSCTWYCAIAFAGSFSGTISIAAGNTYYSPFQDVNVSPRIYIPAGAYLAPGIQLGYSSVPASATVQAVLYLYLVPATT